MAGSVPDSSSEDSGIISSINITPFVDVVLVLLVIFMVTAPMLVKDILEIKLPKTLTGDGKMLQTLGVAVNKDGNILLNGQITDEEGLRVAAKEALGKDPTSQAIISADVEAAYGKVVRVIDLLKSNGVERFAVQIEKEEKK
jgi:biopolymer transport protein ExbD